MPLTPTTTLKADIVNTIESDLYSGSMPASTKVDLESWTDIVVDKIINHFLANATITTNPGQPVTVVVPAGTGTTTGPGTATLT